MDPPREGAGVLNRTRYAKLFAGYNGSNSNDDYVVFGYYGSEERRTTTQRTDPVGSRLPNELGLYDMSGNVWEWTWDWSASYPTGALTDPTGPPSDVYRFYRGGGWVSSASYCTVSGRCAYEPAEPDVSLGFRVVSR